MTRDDIRVLTSVEMGMKNHEYVPIHLIEMISKQKKSPAFQILKSLIQNRLVAYEKSKNHTGYRLSYLGYDYLVLNVLMKRQLLTKVHGKLGVGKESDIYKCSNPEGKHIVLKLARLGRTSFRTIKRNRDYIGNRSSYNWLYLSRIASLKEFSYMQALYQNGFPTPTPIEWNRHGILMSLIEGFPMCKYKEMEDPEPVYHQCMDLIEKMASYGLIHSDFNEFNIMLKPDGEIVMIDFPQMVSMSHKMAKYYFDRDVTCITVFFERRFGFVHKRVPKFEEQNVVRKLDVEIKASGFLKGELKGEDPTKAHAFDILEEYQELNEEEDSEGEELGPKEIAESEDEEEPEEKSGSEEMSNTKEMEIKPDKEPSKIKSNCKEAEETKEEQERQPAEEKKIRFKEKEAENSEDSEEPVSEHSSEEEEERRKGKMPKKSEYDAENENEELLGVGSTKKEDEKNKEFIKKAIKKKYKHVKKVKSFLYFLLHWKQYKTRKNEGKSRKGPGSELGPLGMDID